jgi:uncharacterized protein YecE (DUF72 family)
MHCSGGHFVIRIGTSGFSYADWKGTFYPENIKQKDMLAYYAGQFDTVEINSSFYVIPGEKSFAGMANKTPEDFEFVVKAHKDMTHSEKLDKTIFNRFVGSISPLQSAGKFGCVLTQFPWSFKCTPENKDKLHEFKSYIGDVPTVVEFRNAGWVNDESFVLLADLKFGFCCVDEPKLKGLMPPIAVATSDIGYIRFHGRNTEKWWDHEQAHERYDYMYTEAELMDWMPKIMDMTGKVEKVYIYFNNHYKGKSAANAKMIARMLGLLEPL